MSKSMEQYVDIFYILLLPSYLDLHKPLFELYVVDLADTFHEVKSKREKKKEVRTFELEKVRQICQIC